jgi:hypothetical protein
MHLACAMTRNTGSRLILLHMIPVRNPGLLVTTVGISSFSEDEEKILKEYDMIAEDYGVALTLQPMDYASMADALVQAAENTNACALFARLPDSYFRFWRRLQIWNLRRQLIQRGCQLYTLDPSETVDSYVISSARLKTAK